MESRTIAMPLFSLRAKPVRLTFLLIVLLELVSFFGWARPELGNIAMLGILAAVLIASLIDIRLGVAAMIAELMIGSHGYLFSFAAPGFSVSLRIAMFLVVCSVAFVQACRERRMLAWQSSLRRPLIALAMVILYAIARGVLNGNGFANVFFDANAFLFFAAALPFWQAIRAKNDVWLLLQVAFASALASVAKALVLLYMFSHKLWWALPETYRWVRDTRIGELTQMTDSFFRIFFQSQVYTGIAFFIVMSFLILSSLDAAWFVALRRRSTLYRFGALSAMMASILISLSRSNWMGMVAACVALPVFLRLMRLPAWTWISRLGVYTVCSIVTAIIMITAIILVPFPPTGGSFSASLFGSRALTFKEEAGVGSRWALVGPLWRAISQNPVLGQGFGKEVTYKTQDPRLLAQNPTGEYTTFIFEWGYHDLWLKLGIFGVLAYLFLIGVLMRQGIAWMRENREEYATWEQALVLGMSLGIISLLVTHTTSPYINHPLGISYLLLYGLVLDVLSRTRNVSIDNKP